ncbi:MAG: hypothetical protein U0694_08680 [Anaerolineae bacterium]
MPPYTIQKFDDEPIVLTIFYQDYRLALHGQEGTAELMATLDAQTASVFLILDMRALVLSMNDLLRAITLSTQQYQLFKHSHVTEVVMITDKPFLKASADAMRNPLFGNIRIPVFDSVDAALAYARSQIAAARS